jgi:chromosome segregation ATPase
MKATFGAVVCFALVASASANESNPLGKVFELMSSLEAKIIKEGEAENKAYKEYFEWCDDASKNLANEIKNGKAKQEKLTAQIGELSSDIEVAETKIEELSGAIATNEAELKEATSIRDKEAADLQRLRRSWWKQWTHWTVP